MDTDKSSNQTRITQLSARPARRSSTMQQQQAAQADDVDRSWRECIALNRFGARTEDYTFAGRRH